MGILEDKKKVFSEIASLRVSTEGYPKMVTSNDVQSINEIKANGLDYLTDLLKSLVGFESLKDVVIEALTQNLDDVETSVKKTLKQVLKGLVSCNVDPSLPQDFIDNGISIGVKNIDFLDIMRIEPTSEAGKLIYDDVNGLMNSSDFNTFLYNDIQDLGSNSWGAITTNINILDIKFTEIGEVNNSILVKPSSAYVTKNKLTDLNNDYIDSIKLFNPSKLINNIVDSVFGSISVSIKKDSDVIRRELEIEAIIKNILDADDDDTIDDSYFSFSNENIEYIDYRTTLRKNGTKILTGSNVESTIPIENLTSLSDEMSALSTSLPTSQYNEEITKIIRTGIDNLADVSASNADEQDKLKVKISFIEDMVKQLMIAIINVILSPKLIIIFALNHEITYGSKFDNVQDFMKSNKVLINSVLETVRDEIVDILMAKVLKEIKTLVSDNLIKVQVEKYKNSKAQLLSLTGVPNNILRQVSGLTKT